jgi:hypothetical protein
MRRLTLALLVLWPAAVSADDNATPKDRLFNVDIDLAVANVNDRSLMFSNGREHQTKLPYALLGVYGDVTNHISYRLELDGVNDSPTPEPFTPTAATPFFFPNQTDPTFGASSSPQGFFKVDDYKNAGWNPYIEESVLRRAYVDIHTENRHFGLIAGRFFVPVGFSAEEFHYITNKDLTHIQAINSATDVGFLGYWHFGDSDEVHGSLVAGAISGNGNPYHDYVYFDFTRQNFEDTNSAVGGVSQLRLHPTKGLELALSGKVNFLGSLITVAPTFARSKHYDNALVFGARYRPPFFPWGEVFSEVVSYKWGLRDTSAADLPGPPNESPINKRGYYVGLNLEKALPRPSVKIGVVVTYERLDRDDSLIAYMAANSLLGVTTGAKETSTIVKLYADFGLVTAYFFYNDLQNPFPQASAIEPIAGPFAFGSPGNSKVGFGLRLHGTVFQKGQHP